MSISSNIKRLREAHGLTQAQFGAIAGVTDKAVSTWEAGIKEPRMGAVQKICDYFGISKSEILLSEEERSLLEQPSLVDDELAEYLELLRSRPECRMLFSLAKNATKSDVEKAVAIIEALRKTEGKA